MKKRGQKNQKIQGTKKAPTVRSGQMIGSNGKKSGGEQGVQLLRKLCLLVRGIILVKDALRHCGIDGGDCNGIEGSGLLFVAGIDSGEELLDLRLEGGSDCLVLEVLLFGDGDALFCGFDIGHDITPLKVLSLDKS